MGSDMRATVVLAMVMAAGLAVTGCASRKAVTGEVKRAESRLDERLAQLDDRLGRLEAELRGQGERLGQLEARTAEAAAAAGDATRKAEAAATTAGEAAARAEQAARAAGEAGAPATRAAQPAGSALAGAGAARAATPRGGAPAAGEGSPAGEAVLETATVRFPFDRWELDERAQATLADVLKRVERQGALLLTLEGYTDATGSDGYNFELSRKRAEAVRRFVVDRGVNLRRIEFIGFGETHPAADNLTPAGRAQNRRVLIKLIATE